MTEPQLPAAAPRITTFRLKKGGRVEVVLDDGRTLEIALVVMESEYLSVGDPVDPQLEARLAEATLQARARTAALSLLSFRARSRRELADRLRRKEFPAAAVERCLDDLEAAGWIDDPAFARALVRDRLRLRPRGPGRMTQELRSKGVSEEVARDAVRAVFDDEEVSVAELALEVARGWVRRQSPATRAVLCAADFSPEREKVQRRLYAFLARRGFTGTIARRALDVIRNDPEPR